MKKLLYIALAGLSLAACHNKPAADMPETVIDTANHTGSIDSSGNAANTGNATAPADSVFLNDAHMTGVFEIAAANLAKTNSQDTKVKDFADMIITDHTAMNKDVESLAAQRKITLMDGVGPDLQPKLDKLKGLNGKAFDKEYASINSKGHKDAIEKFEKTSKNQDNSPEVQALAAGALAKLKTHKEHADMLKGGKM